MKYFTVVVELDTVIKLIICFVALLPTLYTIFVYLSWFLGKLEPRELRTGAFPTVSIG